MTDQLGTKENSKEKSQNIKLIKIIKLYIKFEKKKERKVNQALLPS